MNKIQIWHFCFVMICHNKDFTRVKTKKRKIEDIQENYVISISDGVNIDSDMSVMKIFSVLCNERINKEI